MVMSTALKITANRTHTGISPLATRNSRFVKTRLEFDSTKRLQLTDKRLDGNT
jgi:hypothetical protein